MLNALTAAAGAGNLGTLFVRLTADSTKLVKGMKDAETTIASSSAVMVQKVTKMAMGITAAFAAVGAGMAVISVREAMRFEDSFTGVRKTVDATEKEFRQLEAAFRSMAKEIPINVNEVNRIGEAAGALGIATGDILDFTKVMAAMGVTTNLTSDEASTAFARIANITQMSGKDFGRLGSTIVQLGKTTAATESEITEMMLRISGAGNVVGLSVSQIAGFAAGLSSVGIAAEAGGTAISQMMIKMAQAVASGSKELESFATGAGMSAKQFQKAFKEDATGAILKFLEGLKMLSDSGGDAFTFLEEAGLDGIRLTDVMLRASGAGTLFRNAMKSGSDAWKENTALTETAEKRYATFSSQLTLTWNLIKDVLITVGQELVPTLKVLNTVIQDAIKTNGEFRLGFGSLSDAIKSMRGEQIPLLLVAIGAAGDVFSGWSLILKDLEIAFNLLGMVISGSWMLALKAMTTLLETVVNGWVKGINMLITAANKFLPVSKQISKISFNLDIDISAVENYFEAFKQGAAAAREELDAMVARGTFGDRIRTEWEKMTAAVKTETVKQVEAVKVASVAEVEAVKAAQLAIQKERLERAIETKKLMEAFNAIPDLKSMGPGFQPGALGTAGMAQMSALTAEEEEVKKHLAVLKELSDKKVTLTEEENKKRLQMTEAYNQKAQQLQFAQADIILQSSQSVFDNMADMAGKLAGKQSEAYKIMFAASKAFAIAEATVKIALGIASAASLPFPANIPAIASVVAATTGIVSSIQSVQLAFDGERAMGGPVNAGKTYMVGERGPELFSPASSGHITPNDRLGGGPTKVVINNFTDAQASVQEKDSDSGKVLEITIRRIKEEIASEVREGRGSVNKAMEQSFNLRRGR